MMSGDEFYDDETTSGPMPSAAGSGRPPGLTAVGAGESGDRFDYEGLLRVIDQMPRPELVKFLRRLRQRFPTDYERGWDDR